MNEESMNRETMMKLIGVGIAVALALLSVLVLARIATDPGTYGKTIASLDDKRTTVMELTAASAAASAAITLLPGDAATPIADKLADLSGYFLIVICAIYLEKYLLTITGYAAFYLLIPLACLLFSVNLFAKNRTVGSLSIKLAIFGAAIILVVPVSVMISGVIENTYRDSIDATIQTAEQTTETMQEQADDTSDSEDTGLIAGLISQASGAVDDTVAKVEHVLGNMVEALAVMIVTSCIIPIVVLLFFVWLIKAILGIDLGISKKTRIVPLETVGD